MNRKGFTTIELIVSFVMVVVLLGSLIGFTITYRDKVEVEEVKSQLIDFKNTVTKAVYDDIINLNYNSISACVGQDNCVVMTEDSGASHILKIENTCKVVRCSKSPCELEDCGVYLVYNETKYMLPDSNLNSYYKQNTTDEIRVSRSASNLSEFKLKNENSIYNLKMSFKHFQIEDNIEIMLTVN